MLRRVNKSKLLILVFPALLFVGSIAFVHSVKRGQHQVEIREDGFYPAELRIKEGDIVTFVNHTDRLVWPASDPHPTHELLSGFDVGRGIKPEESWKYQFNKPGTWRYHDHLSVSLRGTISVLDNSGQLLADYKCEDSEEKSFTCFDEKIRHAVKAQGIDSAFALFTQLYELGNAPIGCHWTAHLIGEEAYRVFKEGEEFKVTKATSYCGYAFYHGFMELMLRDDPDIKTAMKLCDLVGQQLGSIGQDNCFHGIGHGYTEEEPDKSEWGDPEAMLHPGLDVCEQLFGHTQNKWEICATGVYTVVASYMAAGKYGLQLDGDDPFAFCRTQPKRYDRACYGEFAPKLDKITGWDVSKLGKFVVGIEDQEIKELVVKVAPAVMMQKDAEKDDLSNYVYGCRKLGQFHIPCFRGIVWGLATHGKPEKEYIKIFSFCEQKILTENERLECYKETGEQFRRMYPSDKIASVCSQVGNFRDYCAGLNQ